MAEWTLVIGRLYELQGCGRSSNTVRLVILGGPGAGKGTQSHLLCQQFQIKEIATGNILRTALADTSSALGQQAREYVERGELVPDTTMIQLVRQHLTQLEVASGWLLEGYPRTAFQAEELDFLLDDLQQRLTKAIYIEVPDAVMLERSLTRARLDDTPDAIQRRIDAFHERTKPMLDYYEFRQYLLRVDGSQAIAQVQAEILKKLEV